MTTDDSAVNCAWSSRPRRIQKPCNTAFGSEADRSVLSVTLVATGLPLPWSVRNEVADRGVRSPALPEIEQFRIARCELPVRLGSQL